MPDPNPNPVDRVIEAAGGRQALVALWGIKNQALDGFRRKRYLPLDRAKDAASRFGIPVKDLVRPDIRAAMEQNLGEELLSE
jgi:hypothetical protein